MSIVMLVSHYFGFSGFVVSFEMGSVNPSTVFFF